MQIAKILFWINVNLCSSTTGGPVAWRCPLPACTGTIMPGEEDIPEKMHLKNIFQKLSCNQIFVFRTALDTLTAAHHAAAAQHMNHSSRQDTSPKLWQSCNSMPKNPKKPIILQLPAPPVCPRCMIWTLRSFLRYPPVNEKCLDQWSLSKE